MSVITPKLLYITWCTKYSFKRFATSGTRSMAESCIRIAGRRHGMHVIAVNVQPNQVHALVEIPAAMSESKAAGLLKGESSHDLHAELTYLPEEDPLWGAAYQASAVPEAEMLEVNKYVDYQDERHSTRWN